MRLALPALEQCLFFVVQTKKRRQLKRKLAVIVTTLELDLHKRRQLLANVCTLVSDMLASEDDEASISEELVSARDARRILSYLVEDVPLFLDIGDGGGGPARRASSSSAIDIKSSISASSHPQSMVRAPPQIEEFVDPRENIIQEF